jgi:hypothetical protein
VRFLLLSFFFSGAALAPFSSFAIMVFVQCLIILS